jgi:MFS family permease
VNHATYAVPALNAAIRKTWRRLVPLMFAMYFIAFIDRVNVGFAKDAMAIDIALSQSAFALGAGIFFAAYALFGIPANLLMNRWGAKRWLSATTALWGALSACTGLVTNEQQFIILRFLLGIAEAGFYPGILLLASIYFPNKVRASVIGIFVLGVPAALTLGSPLSGALLEMHGVLGKPGWFWMFVLEGLPAVALGVFAFFYLDDNPRQARFLTEEERTALVTQLADEQQQTETSSVKAAMRSGTVWHLALIYGTLQIGVYGLMFFLPSQVASLMGTHLGFKASLVAAIPWALCRQKNRQKITDRRGVHGRGSAGVGRFFLCRPSARYRRPELLRSQFPGGTADFLDVSRAGAHRPGAGGRHRFLHHARRRIQLLSPADPHGGGTAFSQPACRAAGAGRLFTAVRHAVVGAQKPARRREQARRRDCRIAARYLAIIEPADGTLALSPLPRRY